MSGLPPGVPANHPYFDPPDELGDCVRCDEPVFPRTQLIDDRGRLWHESCAPPAPEECDDPRPRNRSRRPDEVYADVVRDQQAQSAALQAKADAEGVSCLACWDQPTADGASMIDGKPRPSLPCPRCGVTYPARIAAGDVRNVRSSLKAAGAQTVAELCENTGLSRDQVRRALDTLERRGDVGLPTKDGRSMRWSLADRCYASSPGTAGER